MTYSNQGLMVTTIRQELKFEVKKADDDRPTRTPGRGRMVKKLMRLRRSSFSANSQVVPESELIGYPRLVTSPAESASSLMIAFIFMWRIGDRSGASQMRRKF